MKEMKGGEIGAEAVVYIDYKMKLEPVRYTETTTKFYRKKGMSWHGCAVFYTENYNEENGNDMSVENLEPK